MVEEALLKRIQERFLRELRHHFQGWLTKVRRDFSKHGFDSEVAALKTDAVYSSFGLASPEYALIRLMGRVSISIGRRLGEIYDKVPRFVTQARFGLDAASVAPKMGGKLELDVCIPLSRLEAADKTHVEVTTAKYLSGRPLGTGLALEIRYNFNPNDSARLRKDEDMARLLSAQNLLGVYLIFSSISPRDEAIARLTRAGWTFLVGPAATEFMVDLIGMDFGSILSVEAVRQEVEREIAVIMNAIYASNSLKSTVAPYYGVGQDAQLLPPVEDVTITDSGDLLDSLLDEDS